MPAQSATPVPSASARLVESAGLPPVGGWTPVAGGANNRVWRGDTQSDPILLKAYFSNPQDPRDRLWGERAFYSTASLLPKARIPKVLGWDLKERLGLFAFIEGRKLEPHEVTGDHVTQAGSLVADLNQTAPNADASSVPLASEACFSIEEHLQTVGRRVARLRRLEAQDEIDHEAVQWIAKNLVPAWNDVRDQILRKVQSSNLDPTSVLATNDRWHSPSDFGFHNALLAADPAQGLVFFDFEYAGWDDPAKMVCDFFCQPAIPVPIHLWQTFVDRLSVAARWSEAHNRRAQILFPAYQIKWCCIIMNEFLKTEAARRMFSTGVPREDRRMIQLAKAREALDRLNHSPL